MTFHVSFLDLRILKFLDFKLKGTVAPDFFVCHFFIKLSLLVRLDYVQSLFVKKIFGSY